HPERRMDSVVSIIIDRVLGLYSFFILTLLAVAWDWRFVFSHENIRWVAMAATFLFAGMTVFFLVVFSQRLSRRTGLEFVQGKIEPVKKLVKALQRFGKDRKIIALSVLVSILAQMFTLVFFFYLGRAAGEADISWRAVLFVVPMGFLVTAVPIAPAGIGVGQVAFLYLFKAYLEKQTQFGATAITAYQLTVVCWALLGAVLYLRRRKPYDVEQMTEMAETPA
ncbi:MAG: YbhN family protein, partial [Bdellovibrionales bacterium]